MTFRFDDPQLAGYPPIESFLTTQALAVSTGLVNVTGQWPPMAQGQLVAATDPVWGPGEFILAKANGTIPLKAICQLLPTWNSTTRTYDWNAVVLANTANVGRMVAVCVSEQGDSVNALTSGQFGWFQISGLTPVNGTATVAAGTTVGITAAGQIGANSAGKQILNAVSATPATQTVAVASLQTPLNVSGGAIIPVANVDGFFVGGYLSGTGVGASAICKGIDRVNNLLTASVVNSAQVTGNVTITYNNATIFYNVVHLNRPFAQGAIT